MAAGAQVVGDLLGGGDGEAVDDAGAGLLGQVVGEPGQPLLGGRQPDDAELQRLTVEGAAQHQGLGPHLLGDVGGDPGVGGGGRRQHRDAGRQVVEQGADPAVVGPEVVPPVGDAVRLVDHEQPAGGGQPGQHLVAEAGVVEPLRADQEDVDLAGRDRPVGLLPVLEVGGVDRHRADAGPLGGGDLVAHQRQQRRDDHGRPGAGLAQQQRGHEVDRRLAPAGALDDERPALGRPRAPRSPPTGRPAARRRRCRRGRAGAPRRGARDVACSCPPVYQRRPTGGAGPPQAWRRQAAGPFSRTSPTALIASRSSASQSSSCWPDQPHAPGQRVRARPGDAGVDQGVQRQPLRLPQPGHHRRRDVGPQLLVLADPQAPRDLLPEPVLGLAGDLDPLLPGLGPEALGPAGPRLGGLDVGPAGLDVGDRQVAP